jgi:adenosine deaminase
MCQGVRILGTLLSVLDEIRALPKIEIHVHLESSVEAATIAELAASLGEPMPRPVDRLYTYTGLDDLLRTCEWWCDLFRTPEIAEQIAYRDAARMAGDGIVYAEVMAGPRYWPHIPYRELIPAICAGFDRAADDGHTDCRLIPTISRDQSGEWAEELVGWLAGNAPPRVVGLGLDGDEEATGRNSAQFVRAYRRAAELGLGLTAHAGESSGPDGIRDVIDLLDVQRIDHGARAIEEPALVGRLADVRMTLNMCPSSNVKLGIFPSLAQHPVGPMLAAGVPITINSDDCLAVGITLPGELGDVGASLGWTIDDVRAAQRRAVDVVFCDDKRTRELREIVG